MPSLSGWAMDVDHWKSSQRPDGYVMRRQVIYRPTNRKHLTVNSRAIWLRCVCWISAMNRATRLTWQAVHLIMRKSSFNVKCRNEADCPASFLAGC